MNNMQIIKSEKFGNVQCDFYKNEEGIFMGANQLGEVLEYSEPTIAINKLVERNQYLKNEEFSTLTKLVSLDGQVREMRVFTEDGIYEVTMLSKTEKAKEFRAWVRKVLKSLRKGESVLIDSKELEKQKIEAQQLRAKAMLLNAQNRTLKTLMQTINDKQLSPIAVEVFGLTAIENITGIKTGYRPQVEITYSATDIATDIGVSANRVGKMANFHKLKTDEYGITVLDKSPYSNKEVSSFRYNEKGRAKLVELFGGA